MHSYFMQYKYWHDDNAESKRKDVDYWKDFLSAHKLLPDNSDAKILDLGCAMGRLLLAFQELGFTNVEGVEKDKVLYQFSAKEVKNVWNADAVDFLSGNEKKYDRIFLMDVLEHIQKEKQIFLLEKCFQSLTDDGCLVVQVPNAVSPVHSLLFFQDYTHCTPFAELSLEYVLRQAGFSQINIREQGFDAPGVEIHRDFFRKMYQTELGVADPILGLNLVAVAYRTYSEKNTILPKFFTRSSSAQNGAARKKRDNSFVAKKEFTGFPWLDSDRTTLDPMQNLFIDVLPWLEKIPHDFNTILDVGCGTGYMSKFFHDKGHHVVACDPWDRFLFKDEIEYHQTTSKIFEGKKFDAIILSHVLEHIPNPMLFMQEIKELLADDGYLFIMVPMSLRVENGHWWQGWSLPQLAMILAAYGFNCQNAIFEKCGYSACGFGTKTDRLIDTSFTIANHLSHLPATFKDLCIDEGWGYSLWTNTTYIDSSRIERTPHAYAELSTYDWKINDLEAEVQRLKLELDASHASVLAQKLKNILKKFMKLYHCAK